jgi:hypothetical protein
MNSIVKSITIIAVILFSMGAYTGCVGTKSVAVKPLENVDFLSDYSKLKPVPDEEEMKRYINPNADFEKYDKILIDRIKVWYKEDAEYKGIDPTELKALVDYFHEAIVKQLEGTYAIAEKAGPGVMRLRIAITELVPTRPEYSVVVAVTPYATIADLAAGGKKMHSPYLGETAMESELLDSVTSIQLGAMVDRRLGKKYYYDLTKGNKGISDGVGGYIDAYSTWGYAKTAFDKWAEDLRKRIGEFSKGSR